MGKLYDLLREDYRVKEGLKTCINCGTCTAICPAAEFYRYDPRRIVDTVQRGNDERSGTAENVSPASQDVPAGMVRDW